MYKLEQDSNIQKDMRNFIFLLDEKLIYQVVELEVKKFIKENAKTTLKVLKDGYLVIREYPGSSQKTLKTKITQFEVEGDFASQVCNSIEKIKKCKLGNSYEVAKSHYKNTKKDSKAVMCQGM